MCSICSSQSCLSSQNLTVIKNASNQVLLLANLHCITNVVMVHINNRVSHTDSQILILEGVVLFAACSSICLDICHWPLLRFWKKWGRGEGSYFLFEKVQVAANPPSCQYWGAQALFAVDLIGCTLAAVPVLCTGAPFLHTCLHLLAITTENPWM